MRREALLLCIVLLMLSLTGCTGGPHYDDFDIETEGIVDVVVISHSSVMSGRKETETRYYSLANNQRIRLSETFEPDEMTILTVPYDCFESYVDRGKNKVLNRLDHMELKDADRNPISVSDEQSRIFRHLAELEHDLMDIRFIETGGETFVYLELNVNLWTPCCLYWYDHEKDTLVLLHEWDAQEVIGLHLRNITLARYPEE